jgi:3-methyladenine DNA glycosylase AlkD
MHKITKYIITEIDKKSNSKKSDWLENYVKHNIKSKGVGIPDIRNIVKEAASKFGISELKDEKQIVIFDELMQYKFTEGQLASILFLQLYWKNKNTKLQLDLISKWFDNQWIFDWNICDWLCVRILSPMLDNFPKQVIPELKKWNKDEYFWKARASLVPFSECKTIAEHKDIINLFSQRLIKREERFSKTAVGWVLRQYSKTDEQFVINFIRDYKEWTTTEVERNATKYLI